MLLGSLVYKLRWTLKLLKMLVWRARTSGSLPVSFWEPPSSHSSLPLSLGSEDLALYLISFSITPIPSSFSPPSSPSHLP